MSENETTAVIISGTGTGDGKVVVTPAGQPNIVIKVVTPLAAILVRAGKTYLQTLVGLMSASVAGAAPNTLPAGDFWSMLTVCAGLSLAAAVMSVLTNLTLLLTALGEQFPTLRA